MSGREWGIVVGVGLLVGLAIGYICFWESVDTWYIKASTDPVGHWYVCHKTGIVGNAVRRCSSAPMAYGDAVWWIKQRHHIPTETERREGREEPTP